MAIPRSKVFKDRDGFWISHVFFADRWGGISEVVFKSPRFNRALLHAIRNA